MPRERLRRNRRCFADDDALAARVEPQAESSKRPLTRRAARMARPARVRIRRRKPWVLARRRLLGWRCAYSRGSPLLHSHPGICAEGGAGYRVGRVNSFEGQRIPGFRNADRPQSEACGHLHCVADTGMRKQPSTQASSTVREPAGHGQTHLGCQYAAPPKRAKTAYGGAAGVYLSDDTPVNTRFCEHEHYDIDPRTAPREGRRS